MDHSDPSARPVLVLDFGAQYVQLIARRVRERHVFARIVRHDITAERVRELNPLALILSGGPSSVYEPGAPSATRSSSTWASRSWASATACNWRARRSAARSSRRRRASTAGPSAGSSTPTSRSSTDVPRETIVWMSHGDQVHDAGPRLHPAGRHRRPARSPRSSTGRGPFYGLQFHPEVTHTPYGTLILGNFLDRICGNPRTWTMGAFIEQSVEQIRRTGRPDRPGRSAGSPAASIRRSPRRCWRRRSGRRSSASSSTTACSARASGAAVAEAFGVAYQGRPARGRRRRAVPRRPWRA